MLSSCTPMTFVATTDPARAQHFYQGVLGLRFVADEPFALIFDLSGIELRIQKVEALSPVPHTVLGWRVPAIDAAVSELAERGVPCQHYGLPGQDARGIWAAPSGARVAWFKDPDGNVLSLTEF